MTGTKVGPNDSIDERVLEQFLLNNPGLLATFMTTHPDAAGEAMSEVKKTDVDIYNRIAPPAIDSQTGLANRGFLEEQLDIEMDRANRHKVYLSVVIFDIDNFKHNYNDISLQCGDKVIAAMAQILSSESKMRRTDHIMKRIAARYGSGDEYVVLTPHTPEQGAYHLALRVRDRVKEHVIVHDGGKIRFAISGGVAQYFTGETKEEFMERADQALRLAKRVGKDTIVRYSQMDQYLVDGDSRLCLHEKSAGVR